ncbi:tetratricopeptide repeat protein, partial [Nocardia sp. NPDC057353]|uniref:tetratricopeptide repeat protein n=1 Tax=Nocardia sp. NPDC057353 TaxID=3346104 RepID=UPI00363873AC
ALTAIEEAVQLRRTLATQRPDAYLPDLAGSLNNLANRLSGLGRAEQALTAIEEAVQLYRTLATQRPDAYLPDLATSLNNLANRLGGLGRAEEALTAIEEAVQLRRTLATQRPEVYQSALGRSLQVAAANYGRLGVLAKDRGDCGEAERRYQQTLTVFEELGDRAGTATSFSLMGELKSAWGLGGEAVVWHIRALALRAELKVPQAAIDIRALRGLRTELGPQTFTTHALTVLSPEVLEQLDDLLDKAA